MTHSKDRPQTIEQLGHSIFAYNHNITQVEDGYNYEVYLFDHLPRCNEVINKIIKSHYPDGEESALQRKGIVDNHDLEFIAYNEFVEAVKACVKARFEAQ